MQRKTKSGEQLALLACVLIVADTLLMLATFAVVLGYLGLHEGSIQNLLANSPLPLVVYVVWLLGVAGTAAAIVAVVLYNFRERWFWRCMVAGSVAWLAFPPLHAIIGLFALVLLLRNQASFPGPPPQTAQP